MNLYKLEYIHNDKTCLFKRKCKLIKKVDPNSEMNLLDYPAGFYVYGNSIKDTDNFPAICKLENGKILIGN